MSLSWRQCLQASILWLPTSSGNPLGGMLRRLLLRSTRWIADSMFDPSLGSYYTGYPGNISIRPTSLLSAEKEEDIANNLKYSKKYEAEDHDVSMPLNEQGRKKRMMLQDQWNEWVAKWKQWHEEERQLIIQLRYGVVSDEEEEYEAKKVEVEEVLDVREEIVAFDLDEE